MLSEREQALADRVRSEILREDEQYVCFCHYDLDEKHNVHRTYVHTIVDVGVVTDEDLVRYGRYDCRALSDINLESDDVKVIDYGDYITSEDLLSYNI